ncbi:MAG: hypothetical protein KC416_06560 [Myxococcales bacterium]|nr:hypothetical protein [Myxococcales bacterium]
MKLGKSAWSACWWLGIGLVPGCGEGAKSPPTTDAAAPRSGTDAGEDAGDAANPPGTPPECVKPPTHMKIELQGSEGTIRLGHTGFGHGIKLLDGVEWYVELFDCDDSCGECSLSGPVSFPGTPVSHRRCVLAPETECNSDTDCPGSSTCAFFLGPTVETKVYENLQLCSLVHFAELDQPIKNGKREQDTAPVQGSVNLRDGTLFITSMNIGVASWGNIFGSGCGRCNNDETPFDGNRTGICQDPALFDHGLTCDVQGTRANGAKASYECYPAWQTPSRYALQLAQAPLATRAIEWTLTDQHPNCASGGGKCWCGLCEGDPTTPCHPDAPCPGGAKCITAARSAADTCVMPVLGYPPAPCPEPAADSDLGKRGLAECTAQVPETIFSARRVCFSGNGVPGATISARGAASPYRDGGIEPLVAALACFPASGDPDLDKAMGNPGPALIEMPIRAEPVGGQGFWTTDKE